MRTLLAIALLALLLGSCDGVGGLLVAEPTDAGADCPDAGEGQQDAGCGGSGGTTE